MTPKVPKSSVEQTNGARIEREFLSWAHDQNEVNEFYKKGCQEKSFASTGGRDVFLEIQRCVQTFV